MELNFHQLFPGGGEAEDGHLVQAGPRRLDSRYRSRLFAWKCHQGLGDGCQQQDLERQQRLHVEVRLDEALEVVVLGSA